MASNKAVTPASNSLNNYQTHLLKGNGSAVKGDKKIGVKMQANGWGGSDRFGDSDSKRKSRNDSRSVLCFRQKCCETGTGKENGKSFTRNAVDGR